MLQRYILVINTNMKYGNILVFFEYTLNKILNLDPQKQFLLEQLQDQILGLELYDLGYTLYFIPSRYELKIKQYPVTTKVNKLYGSSGMIVGMLISDWPEKFIKKKKINFTGNIKALYRYKFFFKAIRPDLYHYFHNDNFNYFNPIFGLIHRFIKVIKEQLKSRIYELPKNISTYLQEELRIFPCEEEVEDLYDDITELKQGCDRLEKKFII